MDTFLHILKVIGLILLVLLSFNIIIFVHELGHFLAAKWRGLHVEKFQIWFGKPIWKKTIKGVQYGLGSIPAGGFVSLPQMAPMEAIEGNNDERSEPLPPITPMDKIIVAFAGPLFSFLLAVVAAVIISNIGVPDKVTATQTVGYVVKGDKAEQAGFKVGDKIIKIQGEEVNGFRGNLNAISESIIFSEGDKIDFLVERENQQTKETEQLTLTSEFNMEKGTFTQRRGTRKIGIGAADTLIINVIQPGSPASISDFKKDDLIKAINGIKIYSLGQYMDILKENTDKVITVTVIRDGESIDVKTMPLIPSNKWKTHDKAELLPMLGIEKFQQEERKLVLPLPQEPFIASTKDSCLLIISWFNLLIGMLLVILVCNEFSFKTFRQHVIDGNSKADFIVSKILLMTSFALI